MPVPYESAILNVSVTLSSTAQANASVTITNETNDEEQQAFTNSSGEVIFNLANFDSGWVSGDIIKVYALYGAYDATETFQATGGKTVSLALAVRTATAELRYFTSQDLLDTLNLSADTVDSKNGLSTSTIQLVGEGIEAEIDRLTNMRWDSNSGNYVTITNEYHNSDGAPSNWPNDIGVAKSGSEGIFFARFTPIQSLTTFQVNKAIPSSTPNWTTLTEADYELKVRNNIGRIKITDSSDYPAAGKDQVRMTYTYGTATVPKDIKRLAILMTCKAMAGDALQRLNVDVTETEGLSSAIQNLGNVSEEIKRILENRRFNEVRTI